MSRLVQCTSIEDVVEAYVESDYSFYGIFSDRQLLKKFTGDDIDLGARTLKDCLEKWQKNGVSAVFTLCMYEDLPSGGKIKLSSPCDGSVNFQLNKGNPASMGGVQPGSADYTALAVENAILKMKLAALEEEEEEVKEDALMGAIGKIMEIPGVDNMIGAIAGKVTEFIGSIGNKEKDFPDEAKIFDSDGNEIKVRRVSGIDVTTDEAQRVNTSITELSKAIPDLIEMLEKLVKLHKTQPTKFKIFVSSLRHMRV